MLRIGKVLGLVGKSALIGLLAVLVFAVGGPAPGTTWAGPAAQAQSDMSHLEMLSGKDFELDFLSMMIQHHQGAIDMAKLVPDRTNHQELKDVAQGIIGDQTHEIREMTGWLQQWYSTAPKQGMMHEMPGMGMADMKNLETLTGDAFDKAFLTMMRMHHMSAVEMAKLVPARATHNELKTLGQNIITSQTAEIQEFESWAKTWYGLELTGSSMTGGSLPSDTMGGATAGIPRTGSGGNTVLLLPLLALLALGITTAAGGVWLRKRA